MNDNTQAHTGGLDNKPAKCECDGFMDAWSYMTGHYTITVHDEDCPQNPNNFEPPERPDDDEGTPNCTGCHNGCRFCESE